MSIYTIDFTVSRDGITPAEPQTAGVTGDHRAAVLRFAVPYEGYRYRIEITDGGGGYDTTDLLSAENGTVTYAIPVAWTAPGLASLRLVGVDTDENGEELVRFHSAPAFVWFEDRESGEPLGDDARPVWQDTLDAAQSFVKRLEDKLASGELKGDKGDKGDTGDVSVIDELELVIDGGDASGEIELLTADHVVEQGTSGIWTYRKWESGLAECFGVLNTTVATTQAWGDTHYYGRLEGVSFPASLFTEVPAVWVSVSDENGNFFVTNRGATADTVGELFAVTVVQVEQETAVRLSLEAKGRWK